MDEQNVHTHVAAKVRVPYHLTTTTLLEPARKEVSCIVWNIGPEKSFSYDIIGEEGRTLRLRWHYPETLLRKDRIFSKARVGDNAARVLQGAAMESMRVYREKNKISSACKFYVEQEIELPVEVKRSKHQDMTEWFPLPSGLEVIEIRLMATTVYGSSRVRMANHPVFIEGDSSDDEDDEDNESFDGMGISVSPATAIYPTEDINFEMEDAEEMRIL